MASDEEYEPNWGEHESPSEQQEGSGWAGAERELDEEDLLRGATTAEEDEEDEEDDEEEGGQRSIFAEGQDPLSVLAGMERGGPAGQQPFELLAAANRRRRGRSAAVDTDEDDGMDEDGPGPSGRKALFGASVEDIWAQELLDPLKSRRRKKNRERWRRRAKKKGVRPRDMPEEVAAKLGEANLLYASQEHEKAIALLMEVIRLAPNLPDPYHTLGLLHEAVGNAKKALDFYMIAAHITPKDVSLWKRLAEMSSEQGLVRQAIYCYSQALKRDKEDVDARYDRALLYAELEVDKKAIEGFEQVQALRPGHPEVPKALARLHHRAGQPAKAIEVIEAHMERFPASTDLTHINILAELYGEVGRWEDVLALIQRAERDLAAAEEEEEEEDEEPPGLPVDLQVKAGLALAHLGQTDQAVELFACLLSEPVEQFADLYADVGSLLLGMDRPEDALRFFRPLAEHPLVGTPEAWARMAVCHRALGDLPGALRVYQELVARLAPEHPNYVEALLAVAEVHKELGQQAEADKVLDELEALLRSSELLPEDHGAAVQAVLQRAAVLLACGKTEAYLDLALPVLGSTLRTLEAEATEGSHITDPKLRKRLKYIGRKGLKHLLAEGGIVHGFQKYDRRKQHVRELDAQVQALLLTQAQTDSEGEGEGEEPGGLVMRELLREDEPFMLLLQTGQVLVQQKRYTEAREIMQAALDICGKRWSDRWKKDAIRLVLFEGALAQRDFSAAQSALRSACARWPHSPVAWNAYARFLHETGSVRQALKYLQPMRSKHPGSLPLMLLLGHCHLLNTQYSEALGEYLQAWRAKPDEPLVLLCLGAALINQATSRRVPDRHRAVLQAFAFLSEYSRRRRNEQEAAYNIARAAHHLNLLHIAVPFYQRALAAAPLTAAPGHPAQPGAGAAGQQGSAQRADSSGSVAAGAGVQGAAAAAAASAGEEARGDGPMGDDAEVAAAAALGEQQPPAEGQPDAPSADFKYDLRRDAAFNLSLIYRSSGADELAREVLRKYCTV